MRLAEIAVNVPLEDAYTYIIPDNMEPKLYARVEVNFGGRKLTGFVMNLLSDDDPAVQERFKDIQLKEIDKLIDDNPIIDERVIEIAQWMSRFYICPFGETIAAATPSAKKPKKYKHSFHYNGELPKLNDEQQMAFEDIAPAIKTGTGGSYLIHGVTGSGKTEVYKYLVQEALSAGKSTILLIPEISLTPQNLERFYQSFGEEVSIYHSKLTQNEKLGEWMRALMGESHVVIGPRSAVFSPVKNLGLIIIDEEHESSYKSNNSPRYHARQIAYHRAKTEGAVLVFGSATPQIETYYHAKQGTFKLVELKKRYGEAGLPEVTILDLKTKEEEKSLISGELLKKMMETLAQKKQVLLFLNRRGFSPVLICKDCGHTFDCPNCNVSLTYHRSINRLNCHHCGHTIRIPERCPSCESLNLIELGSGTEKLESLIEGYFPNYVIERMDLDTTRSKNSYVEILRKVKSHEADILIGTQMVAKGHDIAGIHLVGVVLPDIILNIPDFRSAEKTFILLTQVIGRAGRRDSRGEAIIQTYLPDHYSIQMAARQDYEGYYNLELEKRKIFRYPPFSRIGRFVVRGPDLDKVTAFASLLKEYLTRRKQAIQSSFKGMEILGPVSCPLEKLKNNYRYHIIIKSNHINEINSIIRTFRDIYKKSPYTRTLNIEIDIDPVSLV